MLGKVFAAQAELEAQVRDLMRLGADTVDTGLLAGCNAQLGALAALQQSLAAAKPRGLAAMRTEVSSAVRASTAVAQQARGAAVADAAAGPQALAASSTALRQEVASLQGDLFERRIFDSSLRFSSGEEADAYRRREAENRRYIEQQLATKTPEGALNAAGGTVGQMLDAQAHGAGASPEFLPRWNRLVNATRTQRDTLRAEGRSTEEFDRRLTASVRRFLHDKGLSEAEIDARLAVAADPLTAVAPYVTSEQEANTLNASLRSSGNSAAVQTTPVTHSVPISPAEASTTLTERAAIPTGVDDVMATFRAAGLSPALTPAEPDFAHGVARNDVAGSAASRDGPE